MRLAPLIPALAAAAAVTAASPAHAATLAGIDSADRLVTFTSSAPAKVRATAISGLPAGETLVGLDRRPNGSVLLAIGRSSRLYRVDVRTGAATAIGSTAFTPGLTGNAFGFDVNPVVDRVRLVSDFAQNLRLQPDTGAVAATDGGLGYLPGDANAGRPPAVSAAAYTNNVVGATTTQLFGIDSARDALVLQDPPNAGGLKTVGALGRDVVGPVNFDILGTDTTFVSARLPGAKGSRLFSIDLRTGRLGAPKRIGASRAPITLRGLTALG